LSDLGHIRLFIENQTLDYLSNVRLKQNKQGVSCHIRNKIYPLDNEMNIMNQLN